MFEECTNAIGVPFAHMERKDKEGFLDHGRKNYMNQLTSLTIGQNSMPSHSQRSTDVK
jgi:hypothetical protein